MKVTAIGTGNAFSALNYNAAFLLEEDGSRMLIDCGQQVLAALRYHKIDLFSIDRIYLSHLHGDHTGSLEAIGFIRYDWMKKPQRSEKGPILIANHTLLKDLWDKTLRGGMESIEGIDANLETFFQTFPVAPGDGNGFSWQGWKCTLIQQVHIMTGSIISSTFGLMMERRGSPTLYFTTDSQFCSPNQIQVFYKKADVIFQDCEVIPFCSGVHANYAQLAGFPDANSTRLSEDTKAKMWLTHYQDIVTIGVKNYHEKSPMEFYRAEKVSDEFNWEDQAAKDGFRGFLKTGQVLEF